MVLMVLMLLMVLMGVVMRMALLLPRYTPGAAHLRGVSSRG